MTDSYEHFVLMILMSLRVFLSHVLLRPGHVEHSTRSLSDPKLLNPGLPDNGYQILSKRLYLPGESLTFVCYQGYELIGEDAIKCIMGTPSFWSGPLPFCMAYSSCFDHHDLEVARETAGSKLDGGNVALAIFIIVLVLSVCCSGGLMCRYHSNLRLPLIYPPRTDRSPWRRSSITRCMRPEE
ncbi:hypothetical protein F7725_015036 [Dissostichus mawsoni]|uniref:Sushi domain-containing protein n=1 Tax=Dissostichus mawsoni TaxID=36200 RepID=A0A7J5YIE3_DISMA|nr:hypothetical protein F7725_015036 [Dissostichus mawsoni]